MFSYDRRFGHASGICYFTGEDGSGGDGNEGAGGGQAASGGSSGANGNGNNGNGTGDDTPEWAQEFGDNFDPERAYRALKASRDAERTAKERARETAEKLRQYENNGKSPFEQLQAENTELQQRLQTIEERERTAAIRAQVTAAAQDAGAHYPEEIARLINEDQLEIGDDGKVRNAPKLVADLKRDRPAFFRPGTSADAGQGRGGNNVPNATNMNDMIRQRAGFTR